MKDVLSTYQIAKFCNVHLTTVINWVNDGVLKGYATPGGHRRIMKEDFMEFVKKYKIPIHGQENQEKRIKRVLVVDDDIEMLEELKEALGGKGYSLDFALSGFEAGRKIYRRKPDLILLDFKMPGMDGFQVCELLKKDPETSEIAIVAVTSLTTEDEIKRIKKCGVKEYMAKPIDIEKLNQLIQKILKG